MKLPVCDEILSNGGLVTANWPSIISLVLEIFNSMPLFMSCRRNLVIGGKNTDDITITKV